jgi:signal transduction histidine kinase
MDPLRVLVTDDEAGMRLGVARALRDYTVRVEPLDAEVAFEVAQAETAEAAREIIRAEPPNILLLDHKLPGMTGLELLEGLQPPPEDMLTIMITAYASIETAVTATKRGAYDFLPKPFTPNELRNTIRKAATHLCLSREARRLAEEKRRVRFEFVRVLGHELKAPLNAVEGYLNILSDRADRVDPGTVQHLTDRSLRRLQQMRKLIVDLLDMTRIESGARERQIGPVDVRQVAADALESVHAEAARREIDLRLEPESGEVPLRADPTEIQIVLNNLVTNAVKYNRDGGRVTVRLQREAAGVRIAVEDTGIGMTPGETERLFSEFGRIRNEKTRDILGSGLGLSILKKIALLYGGDVEVASVPDEGSTFTVRLLDADRVPDSEAVPAPGHEAPTTAETADA